MTLQRRGFRRALAGFALASAAGCGDPTPAIEGKITHKGRPIPLGQVTFIDAQGNACDAYLGDDGRYSIRPARAGTLKVVITGGPAPPGAQKSAAPIPAKYSNRATTDLTAEIGPGPNTFDYDIP